MVSLGNMGSFTNLRLDMGWGEDTKVTFLSKSTWVFVDVLLSLMLVEKRVTLINDFEWKMMVWLNLFKAIMLKLVLMVKIF